MKYRRKINGQWGPWEKMKIKSLDSLPIGSGIEFYGPKNKIPTGFLICDGSAISRTTYSDLFELIGTTYGTGDGSTTFNLPDYRGRVGVGIDENDTTFDTLGKTGGEKTHTLTVNEMPSHHHGVYYADTGGQGNVARPTASGTTTATSNTGGDQPHNNLQPYIVQYFIIKAKNTTPTMASIVNTKNNSTEDGYSCDFINKLLDYTKNTITTATITNGDLISASVKAKKRKDNKVLKLDGYIDLKATYTIARVNISTGFANLVGTDTSIYVAALLQDTTDNDVKKVLTATLSSDGTISMLLNPVITNHNYTIFFMNNEIEL